MAAIKTREIHYTTQDDSPLIGYFAAPETDTPVAGELVAPEWWGRNEYNEQPAREHAEHGYAALGKEMYGDKKVKTNSDQAYQWIMQPFADPDTNVNRATA